MSSLFTSRIFFAVNGTLAMSVAGPSRHLPQRSYPVAMGGEADIARPSQIGRW